MCTVLLPPGGYPIAVNKYKSYISYIIYIVSYRISYLIKRNMDCGEEGRTSSATFRKWMNREAKDKLAGSPGENGGG